MDVCSSMLAAPSANTQDKRGSHHSEIPSHLRL